MRRAERVHGGGGREAQAVAVLKRKGGGSGEEEDHWQSDSVMLSNQEETKHSFPSPTSSVDLSASLGSATDLESLTK